MDGYGKRVLILDDDEDIRHVTGIALTNCRYNVYSAADGAEGLEAMTKRRYDVVLVDYNMPRINGLRFIEISQIAWPKTPIILMSGDVRILDERMHPVGGYACIAKPFAISQLLTLISDACRGLDVLDATPIAVRHDIRGNTSEDMQSDAGLVQECVSSLPQYKVPRSSLSDRSAYS